MHKDVEVVLFSEEEITRRCKELGEMITNDYKGEKVIAIGLLKGSVPFMCELIKRIDLDVQIEFMGISSYSGTESTGEVKIDKDVDCSLKNEHVLIVEDIVDTGRTLYTVKNYLYSKGATDVKIVTLLDKPERRVVDIKSDYVGFETPNEFVIGFGLDYNQKYRNLPYIGVIKKEAI